VCQEAAAHGGGGTLRRLPQADASLRRAAGNVGGDSELAAVLAVAEEIEQSCAGLLRHLLALRDAAPPGAGLREALAEWVRQADAIEWLVPPMLQGRK
jgi:hypothetical protein